MLVSREGGSAHLVSLRDDRRGKTEREFSINEEAPGAAGQGAVFANNEDEIVAFGAVEGCLLIWEKNKIIGAFDHGEDVAIQAVAVRSRLVAIHIMSVMNCRQAFDLGRVVTGTKLGVLSWWDFPSSSSKFMIYFGTPLNAIAGVDSKRLRIK